MLTDTIYAFASGAGRGTIAVLRLSRPSRKTRRKHARKSFSARSRGADRGRQGPIRSRTSARGNKARTSRAAQSAISQNRAGGVGLLQRGVSYIAAMNALLFDTLRLSRILQDKGHFTSEQAEALAEALGEASHGDLATKADLAVAIAGLRTELKTEIAGTKIDLLKWIIVVALGFQTVVILGAHISLVRIVSK